MGDGTMEAAIRRIMSDENRKADKDVGVMAEEIRAVLRKHGFEFDRSASVRHKLTSRRYKIS